MYFLSFNFGVNKMKKQSVTKHNELIQAGYRLTLNEMRIVLYGISLINPLSNEFPLEYQIDIQKFIELFELESSNNTYSLIKETVMDKFWEREFTVDINENKKKRLRWLTSVEYGDKEGFLKIFINPELKNLLHQLKGHFTSYHLDKISSFQSGYSVRIYEISIMNLNQSNKNKCSFCIEIAHLKEQLDITAKYKRFSNFKADVLEPARKEINKHSDINLTYTVKKIGRSPREIEFSIKRKKENVPKITDQNELTLSPPIIEKVRCRIKESGTGWSVQEIIKQFLKHAKKKGRPRNVEGAFIGFVNKIIKRRPA